MKIKLTYFLLLLPSLVATFVMWSDKFIPPGTFVIPKFSAGDCIIHRTHDPSLYEDWEISDFDKITYYRIEEIGKKKYRIGVAKAPSYWKDMDMSHSQFFNNYIKYVDDIYIKAECPEERIN